MKYRPPISNLLSSGCVGGFCPPWSHQWNLGSSKFLCRGEISHLKCGSFDVAGPDLFKCKYTVNSGPWTLDNNQGWTRIITQIQSQAPLFNICGCNGYQVGKLSWLQCAQMCFDSRCSFKISLNPLIPPQGHTHKTFSRNTFWHKTKKCKALYKCQTYQK